MTYTATIFFAKGQNTKKVVRYKIIYIFVFLLHKVFCLYLLSLLSYGDPSGQKTNELKEPIIGLLANQGRKCNQDKENYSYIT